MSEAHVHARKAAAALLMMAKTTSDRTVAAGLVDAAADLKDHAGELPPPLDPRAPDIQPPKGLRPRLEPGGIRWLCDKCTDAPSDSVVGS